MGLLDKIKRLASLPSERAKRKEFLARGLKQVEKQNSLFSKDVYWVDQDGKMQGECRCYDHDALAAIYTYQDDKKEGPFKSYFDNGRVASKGSYKDDEQNGLYERYHKNGRVMLRCTYIDGKMDGVSEIYYENGQLKIKCTYKQGQRNGIYERYHENGVIESKGTFKNDKWDGIYERYHENGQLEKKGTYKNGKRERINERYYENGQLSERCFYKNGEYDGPYEGYAESGAILIKCVFRNGETLIGEEAERYLKKWQEVHREKPKDMIERVYREMKWLPVGKARTPERQQEAERIIKNRRMKSVLSRIAQKAEKDGDKRRVKEMLRECLPYLKEYENNQQAFHEKRIRRKSGR